MLRLITVFSLLLGSLFSPAGLAAQDYQRLFNDFRANELTQSDKRFLQTALAFSGHYNGLLDGAWGPISQRALDQYSMQRFGTSAEDWHMALLAFKFFEEYERDGWAIRYIDGLGMSFLYPFKAISSEPDTDSFINWKHSKSSLGYSIGIHSLETVRNIHKYTSRTHAGSGEPYTVRRKNMAITSSTQSNGTVLYTRSNFIDGAWSTIMISAQRRDVPFLNAVAASISVGRAAPITLTPNGKLASVIEQTIALIDSYEETEPVGTPSSRLHFLQVSSHAQSYDAIATAQLYLKDFPETAVYETQSGYYAVTVGVVELADADKVIANLIERRLVPKDTYATAGNRYTSQIWISPASPNISESPPEPSRVTGSGTGFFVSESGHILTNEHVVENCSQLRIGNKNADLIATDKTFDLALLQVSGEAPEAIATFSPAPARLNSDVTVVGFPLSSILNGVNVTRGAVSSQYGFQGDATRMQITAPVQSGNSGGPVIAADGEVVGVVVSKLDAVAVAEDLGDTPQNVNFAIRGEIAKLFLAQNGVNPQLGTRDTPLPPVELAQAATLFTVYIECIR